MLNEFEKFMLGKNKENTKRFEDFQKPAHQFSILKIIKQCIYYSFVLILKRI